MQAELLKWTRTFAITWSSQFAYRADFIMQVIGPALVFFLVKYNLWSSLFHLSGISQIQGYGQTQMLAYQAWVFLVTLLAQGYNNMNLSEDIRLGKISTHLIYPFSFWKFQTARFLSFQCIQILVAALTLGILVAFDLVEIPNWDHLAMGLAICMSVGVLWFVIAYVLGLAAFWLEETWVLRVMFVLICNFFSGAVFPLEIFPAWLRGILVYSPFPYLTSVPVQYLMGNLHQSVGSVFLAIGFWTLVAWAVAYLVWKNGMRNYAAAGM
ncbi:MAG: ABC-2 family transporter protein [Pseudomonadota bacterium]